MAGERLRGEPQTALWVLSAVRADVERDAVTTSRTASVRVEFEEVVLGSEYFDLPTISVEGAVTAEIEG